MTDDEFYNLVHRRLNDEITGEESAALDQWLHDSPAHQPIYATLTKVWEHSEGRSPERTPDIDAAWQDLQSRLSLVDSSTPANALPLSNRQVPRNWLMDVARPRLWLAAAAILLLAFAGLLWRFSAIDGEFVTITTAAAQTTTVDLPDGSQVTLNSGSTLTYAKAFADSMRAVRLAGEALFAVQSADRAFVVETENASVRVLGTVFNVWARNQETRVIVQEGLVALATATQAERPVVIAANQMSTSRGYELPDPPHLIDSSQQLGWLENRLVFMQAPLDEIAGELERRFDVKIRIADKQIAARTVTASFQDQSVEAILRSLCLTLQLQFTKQGAAYIISE